MNTLLDANHWKVAQLVDELLFAAQERKQLKLQCQAKLKN